MEGQRKDHIDPENPPKRNCSKQQLTHNAPAFDVENTNSTNKGEDLLYVDRPPNLPRGTETMLQVDQRYRKATVHWSAHPQPVQDETKKI